MKYLTLAFIIILVLMPACQAQALELPLQEWDDHYPFRMTFSFPQAISVADNFTADHGSSAASAYHGLTYAGFVANATDTFTYSLNVTWPVAMSGQVFVNVMSYDKSKSFVIPLHNDTNLRLSFRFTLEKQPQIPTAQEFVDLATQGFRSYFEQQNNILNQNLETMNNNMAVLGVGFILIVFMVAWVVVSIIRRK